MTLCWQIAPGAEPAVHRWGDDCVVHHALSNDTFRLSATAGRILTGLMASHSRRADGSGHDGAMQEPEAVNTLSALADLGFVTQC